MSKARNQGVQRELLRAFIPPETMQMVEDEARKLGYVRHNGRFDGVVDISGFIEALLNHRYNMQNAPTDWIQRVREYRKQNTKK